MSNPRIVTYQTLAPSITPPGEHYVGFIRTPKGDRLPVSFFGSTAEVVQESALDFWADELAKAQRRAKPRGKPKKANDPEGEDDAEEFV